MFITGHQVTNLFFNDLVVKRQRNLSKHLHFTFLRKIEVCILSIKKTSVTFYILLYKSTEN